MGRKGPSKHLKRLHAPKHWMLDKLGGVFAPKPSSGPHKTRECLPLTLFLRNRLHYAITGDEVKKILLQRLVRVDGKVRIDPTFPAGFMDVVNLERTKENFRLIYDNKGRFCVHRITRAEAEYKLLRVNSKSVGSKGVPYIVTHDGRTIRYPDPLVKANDTVKYNLKTDKIESFLKFEAGNLVMVTGGHNIGRVGLITSRERHPGSFDIVHIKDDRGNSFATRLNYVFVIGNGLEPFISLPRDKGIRLTITEERDRRIAGKATSK